MGTDAEDRAIKAAFDREQEAKRAQRDDPLDRQAALRRKERFIQQEHDAKRRRDMENSRRRTAQAIRMTPAFRLEEGKPVLLNAAMVARVLGADAMGKVEAKSAREAFQWQQVQMGRYRDAFVTADQVVMACNQGKFGPSNMGRFEIVEFLTSDDLRSRGLAVGYLTPEHLLNLAAGSGIRMETDSPNASLVDAFFAAKRHFAHWTGVKRSLAYDHHFIEHVWVLEGYPNWGEGKAVSSVEGAVPLRVLLDHKHGGRLVFIQSLKDDPDAVEAARRSPGDAAPFRLRILSGLIEFETLPGAEDCCGRIEELAQDGVEITLAPKARRILEISGLPSPEAEDGDSGDPGAPESDTDADSGE